MNKYKIITSAMYIIIIMVIELGCKGDTGSMGPTGPGGPNLTGKITGVVVLTDTNGVQPTKRSGISVQIEGTNKSTLTDSTGKWVLDTMTTGTYAIDISKNTYGITKRINFQFVGGGSTFVGTDFLSEMPNFTVSNITATNGSSAGNNYVDIKGNVSYNSPQSVGRNILIFIGTDASVSNDPAHYLGVENAFATDTAASFTLRINASVFSSLGIPEGSGAYIAVYPSSATAGNSSRYTDVVTGRFFYTSLPSNPVVLNITAPMYR